MPKTLREIAQRKIEQAKNLLDTTGAHLNWIESTYREAHPEISDPVLTAMQTIASIMVFLEELKQQF
jgi:hypothetical protein